MSHPPRCRSRALRLVTLTLALAGALAAGPAGAASPVAEKVLGLHVESTDLTAKDRTDLFQVVQAKLRRYPHFDLVQPPERELTDEMIELECIDIDVDCLAKLGRKYGAVKVFYAQVDEAEGAFDLLVRVADVTTGASLRDKTTRVAAQGDLAGALEREVEAVFGPPPPPEEVATTGTLVIDAGTPGARIYVDGQFAGTGRISVPREAGEYMVLVEADGYEDALFPVRVEAGQTVDRAVRMKPLATTGPPPDEPPAAEPPAEGRKKVTRTWWFWTIVAVAAAGAATGVALAVSGDDETVPRGTVLLSVDPEEAWRDAAILRRASP